MPTFNEALASFSLKDDSLGYLLGRGAKEETLTELSCKTWTGVPSLDGSTFEFEGLEGWVIIPLLTPRGHLMGFEGRNTTQKEITQYRLPESSWNPEWHGMRPSVMSKIWNGSDIWIVEGIFDVFPLEWAIPEKDVVLGTVRARLTTKHVDFLKRFCSGWVHLVYDNDEAGRKATYGWTDKGGKRKWGATKKLQNAKVKYCVEPYTAKDPGEIWSQFGVDGICKVFSK